MSEPPLNEPPLRIAFETLGCRSNHADTVDLQSSAAEHGAVPCSFDSVADVYVINTCTVTDDADRTALRLIRQAKAKSASARIVVTGCMAEVDAPRILALEMADAVVGPGDRTAVLEAILGKHAPGSHSEKAPSVQEPLSPELTGPGEFLGEVKSRSRFHLRVQEGCENSCTFCIIPRARGSLVSRPRETVLEDLHRLVDLGYREVVLTGTHLGGYGEDCGSSLRELLEFLAEKSPLRRLRMSSLDPNDVSFEIIDLVSASDAFCNHLHICIQAFSDATLKRMNRRYRLRSVVELLEYVVERWPGCAVGSDLIVGFPGESRQDVDQGLETFLALPISYLHVFPYSERSGTPAAEFGASRLGGIIEPAERKRRAARFRALSDRRKLDFYRSLIGKDLDVVIEGERGTRPVAASAAGTSREFANVRVDLSESLSAESRPKPGELIRCRAEAVDTIGGEIVCSSFVRER